MRDHATRGRIRLTMKLNRTFCILLFVCYCCSCNPVRLNDGLPAGAKDVHRATYGVRDYSKYVTASITKREYQNYINKQGYTNIVTLSFLESIKGKGPMPSWWYEGNKSEEWWNISNNELLGSYIIIHDNNSYSLLTYKDGIMYLKYERW